MSNLNNNQEEIEKAHKPINMTPPPQSEHKGFDVDPEVKEEAESKKAEEAHPKELKPEPEELKQEADSKKESDVPHTDKKDDTKVVYLCGFEQLWDENSVTNKYKLFDGATFCDILIPLNLNPKLFEPCIIETDEFHIASKIIPHTSKRTRDERIAEFFDNITPSVEGVVTSITKNNTLIINTNNGEAKVYAHKLVDEMGIKKGYRIKAIGKIGEENGKLECSALIIVGKEHIKPPAEKIDDLALDDATKNKLKEFITKNADVDVPYEKIEANIISEFNKTTNPDIDAILETVSFDIKRVKDHKERMKPVIYPLTEKINILDTQKNGKHIISLDDTTPSNILAEFKQNWTTSPKKFAELEKLIKKLRPELKEINLSENIREFAKKVQAKWPVLDQEDKGKDDDEKTTIGEILLGYISKMELFHNQNKEAYARLPVDDEHHVIVTLASKEFKQWLSGQYYNDTKKVASGSTLNDVINTMSSIAVFKGEMHTLHNRACMIDNVLWYDLGNNEAVKITPGNCEIIKNVPILFRKYSHMQAHKDVVLTGDVNAILPFLNIKSKNGKILTLVTMVSYFIANIPRPILVFYGQAGSGKSGMMRIIRGLVDPSDNELLSLPDKDNELIQQLAHNYLAAYDNIKRLTSSQSDIFCRADTGDGNSKRALYSDEDDVIFKYIRAIMFNGINQIVSQPDLLDRSELIETEEIPKNERLTELEIKAEFLKVRPTILGGVFAVLVKAMEIYPTIKLTEKPRMADFCVWGCSIAEAMGYTQEEFLKAYEENIAEQNSEALENSELGYLIDKLMMGRSSWAGSTTELLDALVDIILNSGDKPGKYFPSDAKGLTTQITKIIPNFRSIGLRITQIRNSKFRGYMIVNEKLKAEAINSEGKRVISSKGEAYEYMKSVIQYELGIKSKPAPFSEEESKIKNTIKERVTIFNPEFPFLFEECYNNQWSTIKISL